MDEPDLQSLLREGIAAAKAAEQEPESPEKSPQKRIYRISAAKVSQRERARQLLLHVTELDETNIPAWLWLSTVMDEVEEKKICLENVLTLDPDHNAARAGLARLDQLAHLSKPEPAPTQSAASHQNQAIPQPTARPAAKDGVSQAKSAPSKSSGIACPFCRRATSALATSCSSCQLPLVMNCPVCSAAVDIEEKTCAQCKHAMGNYRQGASYFARLAAAYQERESYQDTLKAWQAVEILNPDYPQLHLRLGEAHLGLGRPDRATLSFQRAQREESDSADVQFAMGELLRQRGERQEAFSHFYKAAQLDPEHGMAWLRLGQLYQQVRRNQEADQAYRRAAALLSTASSEGRQAQQQLDLLQVRLPETMATGWSELMRQMTGPVMVCLLAALLDSGLRPWWIHWTGWLALILAVVGAFLCISGTSLPRNPLIRQLIGGEGGVSSEVGLPIAIFGGMCWLLALGIILLPLGGQSFPEPPTL